MGNSSINGPFSIAMLVYQRVYHIPHDKFAACVLAHQDLGNHRLHRVHRPRGLHAMAETRVKLQQEINMLKRHFDIILSTSGKCPFYSFFPEKMNHSWFILWDLHLNTMGLSGKMGTPESSHFDGFSMDPTRVSHPSCEAGCRSICCACRRISPLGPSIHTAAGTSFGCWWIRMSFKSRLIHGGTCMYIYIYIPRPSNDTFICVSILFCSCCGFSLVCKKLLFCRKNARGGSFLPHCQLDLLQFLNLRLFCTFLRIFAAFLRKFSLELVSHQSKQFLFSVELG